MTRQQGAPGLERVEASPEDARRPRHDRHPTRDLLHLAASPGCPDAHSMRPAGRIRDTIASQGALFWRTTIIGSRVGRRRRGKGAPAAPPAFLCRDLI
jgi:hypothetical protein